MSRNRKKFERLLLSSVSNLAMSFADAYIEKNVERRASAGLKVTVIRRQVGNCCKWCRNLAGIYTADQLPDDIYKRHANCRCMVTYKTEKVYTDAWSKKQFETQKAARLEREKELKTEATEREARQKIERLEFERKFKESHSKGNRERQRQIMLGKERELLKLMNSSKEKETTAKNMLDIEKINDTISLGGVFVNKNEKLAGYAKKIEPINGYTDFLCHCDSENFTIKLNDGTEYIMTPAEYAEHIKASKEYNDNDKIRLFSCRAGAQENGAAQQLANILQKEILAPTEVISVDENGNYFITDNIVLAEIWDNATDGEKAKIKQTGQWRTFKPEK